MQITAFLLATQALVDPEIKKVLPIPDRLSNRLYDDGLGIAGLSTNSSRVTRQDSSQLMKSRPIQGVSLHGHGCPSAHCGLRYMTDMGGMRKHMKKDIHIHALSRIDRLRACATGDLWLLEERTRYLAAVLEVWIRTMLHPFLRLSVASCNYDRLLHL